MLSGRTKKSIRVSESKTRMRILLHALGVVMGGATRHLSGFLPELARAKGRHDYTVLVRESLAPKISSSGIRVETVPDRNAASWIYRIADDVLALPGRLRRENYSAIVSLTNFGPVWTGIPHIVFQRNSLYYCPYYLERIGGLLKLEILLRRRIAKAMMNRAARVVTPSNSMAEMILRYTPSLRRDHLRTLYHGVDAHSMNDELNPKLSTIVGEARGAKLIYPSHLSFYKGFAEMFELLRCAKSEGMAFTLFLTIDEGDNPSLVRDYKRRVRVLGLEKHVRWLGAVPQNEMGALYRSCDAMLFPSLCESFGFPMLEALAHGLPVMAADTSVNREICGEAAVYISPDKPMQGGKALMEALSPQNRLALVERGRSRLQEFDWGWERYAREFVALIEEVV